MLPVFLKTRTNSVKFLKKVWVLVNFLKRREYQTTLPAS